MLYRTIATAIIAGALSAAAATAQTTTAPATAPAPSVAQELAKIQSLLRRPSATSQEEFEAKAKANLKAVLDVVAEMEKNHPDAPELNQARLPGLLAACTLAKMNDDAAMADRARAIIKTILAGNGPTQLKLVAEAQGILLDLQHVGAPASQPATQPATPPAQRIAALPKRYAKTDAAAEALVAAHSLANLAGEDKLAMEFAEQFIKEHPGHPAAEGIRKFLATAPLHKVGKPFEATLTKLDGTKLTLPEDMKGKVYVVDFWATWCGPCVGEIPRMKKVYAAYKPKGVEFVGISLDFDGQKDKLAEFVKERAMGWIHTYTGKGWQDPTAQAYGVNGIPSMYVIGKDGAIFSNNARGNLEAVLDAALKAPAPTTAPTTKPAKE